MIRSYPKSDPPWSNATWLDLCESTEEERAQVEAATGLRVPTELEVSEIESSSRVFTENGASYLSTPVPSSGDAHTPLSAVGFVLTQRVLITVRFANHAVLDSAFLACEMSSGQTACEAFLRILEALVDRAADALEHASSDLDSVSHAAFHSEKSRGKQLRQKTQSLHQALRKLGQIGDRVSQIRETLLGIGRIAAFVMETNAALVSPAEQARLKAIRADISSLNDYQGHLSGKVQFLLDATLGFINIEQNDIVKTLTIVSVVGVPPVLVAGIYGMNFRHMPELDWPWGYPFALLLMLVTGLAPLLWFKWRGWM